LSIGANVGRQQYGINADVSASESDFCEVPDIQKVYLMKLATTRGDTKTRENGLGHGCSEPSLQINQVILSSAIRFVAHGDRITPIVRKQLTQWALTPGGQPHYSTLAITTALTMRMVFGLGPRQTEGLIGSVIGLLGLDLRYRATPR
jgi:hypothetical protein